MMICGYRKINTIVERTVKSIEMFLFLPFQPYFLLIHRLPIYQKQSALLWWKGLQFLFRT